MPELGKDLSALLDSSGSPDEAVHGIINAPALLAECRAALPHLKRVAETKAGVEGVRMVISKRFETFPPTQRTEEQWAAWWADYFETLADVTLASLEAGMRQYVADPTSEFMPKPGKLRELAFLAPCRSLNRYYRAKRAIQIADEPVALPAPPVDPEEVRALLEEFRAKSAVNAPKPEMPSVAGKPDEGGITQAMRDLIARREAA